MNLDNGGNLDSSGIRERNFLSKAITPSELNELKNKINSERYLQSSRTSKRELFAKIVNGIQFNYFGEKAIVDVRLGSKYNSVLTNY